MINDWIIYIIECADRSFYTGITTSISRRIDEHNRGKGGKYTRTRRPVKLIASVAGLTRTQALQIEYRTKNEPRKKKKKYMLKVARMYNTLNELSNKS